MYLIFCQPLILLVVCPLVSQFLDEVIGLSISMSTGICLSTVNLTHLFVSACLYLLPFFSHYYLHLYFSVSFSAL